MKGNSGNKVPTKIWLLIIFAVVLTYVITKNVMTDKIYEEVLNEYNTFLQNSGRQASQANTPNSPLLAADNSGVNPSGQVNNRELPSINPQLTSIEDNVFIKQELENHEEKYYRYYLHSHEDILSEIFSLDYSRPEDVEKYYNIAFEDDGYILNQTFVDLNNDGHQDLLIENYSRDYYGSGGASTYIFMYENERYKFLQEFFGDYIVPQPTKTNGYNDIRFYFKTYLDGGGSDHISVLMRWDGNEYVRDN